VPTKRKAKSKLTAKQQRFVDQYLVDRNAGAAYIRAGFAAKNRAVADTAASRLLRNVQVRKAVAKGEAEIAERTKVTVERIEKELALIAFGDLATFVEWGGNGITLKDSGQLPQDMTRIVQEVGDTRRVIGRTPEDEGGLEITLQERKIKLYNKLDALKELAKRHGFYVPPTGGKGEDNVRKLVLSMVNMEQPGDEEA
jgi:phage terminase small subunit